MRTHFACPFDVRSYIDKRGVLWFHISKVIVLPALQGAYLPTPPRCLYFQSVHSCCRRLCYRWPPSHIPAPSPSPPPPSPLLVRGLWLTPTSAKDVPDPVQLGIPPSPPPPRAMNCGRCMVASVNFCRSSSCLDIILSIWRKCGGVSAPVVINRSRKVNMYRTSVYECFHQSLFSANSSNFII